MGGRRADAERNRERVILAAAAVHAEQGPKLGMQDVARRAGVGVGTVYRHFATREGLIDALAQPHFSDVVELAQRVLDEQPAGEAFFTFVREFAEQTAEHGLPGHCQIDGPAGEAIRTEVRALLDTLIASAADAGTLAPDVTRRDAAALLWTITSLVDATRAQPEIWRRHVDVALAGLRADGTRPISAPEVGAEAWEAFRASAAGRHASRG